MKKHFRLAGFLTVLFAACSHNTQRLPASTNHSIEESTLDQATNVDQPNAHSCWNLATRTKLQTFQIYKATQSGTMPTPLSLGSYQRQLLDLYALNESELEWIADLTESSQTLGAALRFVKSPEYKQPGQASEDLKAASWVALWLLAKDKAACQEFFTDLMRQDRHGMGSKFFAEIQATADSPLKELTLQRDQQWNQVFKEISQLENSHPGSQNKLRVQSQQRFEVLLGFVAKEYPECARLRSIASEVIESPLAAQHQLAIQSCKDRVQEKLSAYSEQMASVERDLESFKTEDASQRKRFLEEELRSLASQKLRYQGVLDTLQINNASPTLQSLRLAELVQKTTTQRLRPIDLGFSIKSLRTPWQKASQLDQSLALSFLRAGPQRKPPLRLHVSPQFAPSVTFLFEHGLL
jgi:hypothetical protein